MARCDGGHELATELILTAYASGRGYDRASYRSAREEAYAGWRRALPFLSLPGESHDYAPCRHASPRAVPLGQRLFDNVFLLLGAGLLVMFVLYTGWGLWEITSLPAATLP